MQISNTTCAVIFFVRLIDSKGEVIAMDGNVIAALITVVGGTFAVIHTQRENKKRDHEEDWRKLKLEYYKEYVAAMSGAARKDADDKAFLRYSDAADNLALVASTEVLKALNALHNAGKLGKTEDLEPSSCLLMRAMRKDCHPKDPKDDRALSFTGIDLRTIVTRSERAKQ
jgi:hypothetical protein